MALAAEVPKAERFALEQRLRFAPLMKVDTSKTMVPAEAALCSKVAEMAESDPLKWDEMLKLQTVNKLFIRGALYFERGAA